MIQTITVCGAGTMGSGIAQTAASAGFHTTLYDVNPTVLADAQRSIEKNLHGLVKKNKLTVVEKNSIYNRLCFTTDLFDCISDVIIEAIVEKQEAKISLFNQLAEINHSETVFATNTSSLSVSQIAAGIKNPERVIGLHFFNPAPIMKLVEIVMPTTTNTATLELMVALTKKMGKTTVVCKDAPGFIVNRVARPYYIEALRLLENNFSSPSAIDTLMESTGFKMGPFKLMDLIGNDINYAVSCSVYEQMGKPERLLPSFIQKDKVATGALGKKTKKGYYNYD